MIICGVIEICGSAERVCVGCSMLVDEFVARVSCLMARDRESEDREDRDLRYDREKHQGDDRAVDGGGMQRLP